MNQEKGASGYPFGLALEFDSLWFRGSRGGDLVLSFCDGGGEKLSLVFIKACCGI